MKNFIEVRQIILLLLLFISSVVYGFSSRRTDYSGEYDHKSKSQSRPDSTQEEISENSQERVSTSSKASHHRNQDFEHEKRPGLKSHKLLYPENPDFEPERRAEIPDCEDEDNNEEDETPQTKNPYLSASENRGIGDEENIFDSDSEITDKPVSRYGNYKGRIPERGIFIPERPRIDNSFRSWRNSNKWRARPASRSLKVHDSRHARSPSKDPDGRTLSGVNLVGEIPCRPKEIRFGKHFGRQHY